MELHNRGRSALPNDTFTSDAQIMYLRGVSFSLYRLGTSYPASAGSGWGARRKVRTDIFVHGPGSETPETIEIGQTIALVRELLAGRDGELVWVEEVDVPIEVDVELTAAGIDPGYHVHRGPSP